MYRQRTTSPSQAPVLPAVADQAFEPDQPSWSNAAAAEQLAGQGPAGDSAARETAPASAGPAGFAALVPELLRVIDEFLRGVEAEDMRREGTITDPRTGLAVRVPQAQAEAGGRHQRFGDHLMNRYAFQPSAERTVAPDDKTLRFVSPGLNTPEPEAARRTQYYADHLGQPMVHLHNGTRQNADLPAANRLDYLENIVTRSLPGHSTDLIDNMSQVLTTALTGAEPQDVHAILYSDATLAGSRAIGRVRQQMIESRVSSGMSPDQASAEVGALLEKHLFVEMHGNVVDDLPAGPRYMLWADRKDQLTHQPLPGGKTAGLSARNPDADANAVYVEYDGPIGGEDSHNLAATGVHAVRATWAANGVSSSQELFEQAKANGGQVAPHLPYQGDVTQLWNPENDPALQRKTP